MSLWNNFGTVALKIGDLEMRHYIPGDSVNIPDGVYVGYEGVVVIMAGVFVAEFHMIKTKWGDQIDIDKLLYDYNPVEKAIKRLLQKEPKIIKE